MSPRGTKALPVAGVEAILTQDRIATRIADFYARENARDRVHAEQLARNARRLRLLERVLLAGLVTWLGVLVWR